MQIFFNGREPFGCCEIIEIRFPYGVAEDRYGKKTIDRESRFRGLVDAWIVACSGCSGVVIIGAKNDGAIRIVLAGRLCDGLKVATVQGD